MDQKFHRGDYVTATIHEYDGTDRQIEAIVVGSYADLYGGKSRDSYKLFPKPGSQAHVAWYTERQLTLIHTDQYLRLAVWEAAADATRKTQSDLDWIFAHGDDVLEHRLGPSLATLAACLGMTNLWGKNGEGCVYYQNVVTLLSLARPFLETGDRAGWETYCRSAVDNAKNQAS